MDTETLIHDENIKRKICGINMMKKSLFIPLFLTMAQTGLGSKTIFDAISEFYYGPRFCENYNILHLVATLVLSMIMIQFASVSIVFCYGLHESNEILTLRYKESLKPYI